MGSETSNTPNSQRLAELACAAMWEGDIASQDMGMSLDTVGPGFAELTMPVRDNMLNGVGTVHGGYVFALADSAFAFACNSQNEVAVASGVRIEYVKAGRKGDVLRAVGREVSQGKRVGVYDVEVFNQDDELLALFRGNSHRINKQHVDPSTLK